MKFSHTKLSTLLDCPMTYHLHYERGISPKAEKPALQIGSAVHWGIEHDTDELEAYYKKAYSEYAMNDHCAEAMCYGYKLHKDEIMRQVLKREDGYQYKVIEEYHEIKLTAQIPSERFECVHEFEGIVDLLLLTEDGFILVDYKTSTGIPNWYKYLDQIYRYMFLLKANFPDVPIVRFGIINLRKTQLRLKKSETTEAFVRRIRFEYECNDDEYITFHSFTEDDISEEKYKAYIKNLERMCDTATVIADNKLWYVNYAHAEEYGGSEYKSLVYEEPDAYYSFKIRDTIVNEFDELEAYRDCVSIDVRLDVPYERILNSFDKYVTEWNESDTKDFELFHKSLEKKYITDEKLLEKYRKTLVYKQSENT